MAHRSVLTAASGYFRHLQPSFSQGCLTLDGEVKHEDLGLILDFIYEGEVSVKETNIESFLRSAKVCHVMSIVISNVVFRWDLRLEEL